MTVIVRRLSDASTPGARREWVNSFIGSAAVLRRGDFERHAPSAAYSELVLTLASQRPSELFLAVDGDRPRARALAATSFGTATAGVIGLFEMASDADSADAAAAVVSSAETWAVANGHSEVFAPVDVSTWFSYRFSLLPDEAVPQPPLFSWEPAQPAMYPHLFRSYGYVEAERYHTIGGELLASGGYGTVDATQATAGALEQSLATGYRFERLKTPDQLDALLAEMHVICMAAFRDNMLFEPLPAELFTVLYKQAAATYDCSPSHWVRDTTGRLVGFVLAFVDGVTVVVKTIAVAPDARGQRLSSALVHCVLREAAARGYTKFVSALVRRGNASEFLSQSHVIPSVSTWRREYALLHKQLPSR